MKMATKIVASKGVQRLKRPVFFFKWEENKSNI